MPNYAITGDLGAGKGLFAVQQMRLAMLEGRRVATNFDLYLDKLLPGSNKACAVRVPDYPSVADLDAIGIGNDDYDEKKNGLLVLDELGAWLNSRDFQDKGRKELLLWLIHSRKKGWNVLFLMQDECQIDKQVRTALLKYFVRCIALHDVDVPVVGWLIRLVSCGLMTGKLPAFHMATTRVGAERDALQAGRQMYRGTELYAGYDTRQEFSPFYDTGIYSMLSAWHLKGRYEALPLSFWRSLLYQLVPSLRPVPRLRPCVEEKPQLMRELMKFPPHYRWSKARDLVSRGVF